jgi:hypothetical protein
MIQNALSAVESDICHAMERNEQTEYSDEKFKLTLKRDKRGCAVTFNQEFGELDILTKEQFNDIYTEEHTVVKDVPAKINLAKIRKLRKFGSEVWEKADKAILKGDWRISSFKQIKKRK